MNIKVINNGVTDGCANISGITDIKRRKSRRICGRA